MSAATAVKRMDASLSASLTHLALPPLTLESSYAEVLLAQGGRFKDLSRERHAELKRAFSAAASGMPLSLDLPALMRVFEGLGDAKTYMEARGMFAHADRACSGRIGFEAFLEVITGPTPPDAAPTSSSLQAPAASGEILSTSQPKLEKAAFFERVIQELARDPVAESRASLTKDAEARRLATQLRKEERELELKAQEAAAREDQQRKERLKERTKQLYGQ